MGGPEHQICLSKGVIGKYVLGLKLAAAQAAHQKQKATAMVAFWCFGLS
jgi:hypothetical protein